jgi:hypothetical protein
MVFFFLYSLILFVNNRRLIVFGQVDARSSAHSPGRNIDCVAITIVRQWRRYAWGSHGCCGTNIIYLCLPLPRIFYSAPSLKSAYSCVLLYLCGCILYSMQVLEEDEDEDLDSGNQPRAEKTLLTPAEQSVQLFQTLNGVLQAVRLENLRATPYKEALLAIVARLLHRILHLCGSAGIVPASSAEAAVETAVLNQLKLLQTEMNDLYAAEDGTFTSYFQQLANVVLASDRLRPTGQRLCGAFKFIDNAVTATPVPEPEPVAEPTQWACEVCTFENPNALPTCEMCGSNKPPPKKKTELKRAGYAAVIGSCESMCI